MRRDRAKQFIRPSAEIRPQDGRFRPVQARNRQPGFRGPALLLAVLAACQLAAAPSPPPEAPTRGPDASIDASTPVVHSESFRRDWVDDIIDDLGDIDDDAVGAEATVTLAGGLLGEADKLEVAERLDDLVVQIDLLLESGNIPEAEYGVIDERVEPASLDDYAEAVAGLSLDALDEATDGGASMDGAFVASQLKTIHNLITRSSPHNYRSVAGVE